MAQGAKNEQIAEIFREAAELTKDKDLFEQRLAPRYAVLDKLKEAADMLKKKSENQSDAYKEGVCLVLQMIDDMRKLYKQANSLLLLQCIAPEDHEDVDSFVKAINGMMKAVRGQEK